MPAIATFEFDHAEYYRGIRAVQAHNPYRWLIPVAGIVVPVTMIWLAIGDSWQRIGPWLAFQNALPWLLLGVFYLTMMPLMARGAAKKALENDPSLRGTQSRAVDADGVHIVGAGFRQDLSWKDLVKSVETEEFFLFFYNKRQAHYLPKRALDSGSIEEVRRLIHSRAASGARVGAAPA